METELNINITENDLKIMSCMFDKETGLGLSKAKGITIEEIHSKITNVSLSKIRDTLNKLLKLCFIDYGIKRGRKNSYHVTAQGFNYIIEIKKNVIEIK